MSSQESIIEEIRRLVAGHSLFEKYEILCRETEELILESRQSKFSHIEKKKETRVGIRLISSGHTVDLMTDQTDLSSLKMLVENAKDLLSEAPLDPQADMKPISYLGESEWAIEKDHAFDLLSIDEKKNKLLNLEANVSKYQPESKSLSASYRESSLKESYWNNLSAKSLYCEKRKGFLSLEVVAQRASQQQWARAWCEEANFFDIDWNAIAKEATHRAIKLLGVKAIPAYRGPVIVYRKAMLDLLMLLAYSLRGDVALEQDNFFIKKRGQKLFSPELTLTDDPFLKKRVGSRLWDSEGTPCRRLDLILQGEFRSFALDHSSAKALGLESTGHGDRKKDSMIPQVDFHNLFISPGNKSFSDLLTDMKDGILIYRVNTVRSGQGFLSDLNFYFEGTRLVGGVESESVCGTLKVKNLIELFSQVLAVARDLCWYGPYGTPSVLFKELELNG